MKPTSPQSSWVKRGTGLSRTILGTLLVFALAGGAIYAGSTTLTERAADVAGPDPAPLLTASALRIAPKTNHVIARQFHGQVEPAQSVDLAFQQAGEILTLSVDEGDRVQAGQVLGALDTRILDAERRRLVASRQALEAQAELAQLTTERQRQLSARGFAAQQVLDEARLGLANLQARLAEIDAAITRVDVQRDHTQLIAPFDGIVAARLADQGTIAAVGQTVLEVMETQAPIFRVGIDPQLALKPDALNTASIEINGNVYPARFVGFRADLDPLTRTRTALFRLNADEAVYRQSGILTLRRTLEHEGYLLPLSALQEGVRGLWTVLTLTPTEEDGTFVLGTAAVEILHVSGDQVFVRGTLAGEVAIVAEGTHRFVPGDRVRIKDALKIAEAM